MPFWLFFWHFSTMFGAFWDVYVLHWFCLDPLLLMLSILKGKNPTFIGKTSKVMRVRSVTFRYHLMLLLDSKVDVEVKSSHFVCRNKFDGILEKISSNWGCWGQRRIVWERKVSILVGKGPQHIISRLISDLD